MGRIAGYSPPAFPAALKPIFPRDFADRGPSSLDSTATAQVPEAVPNALRRFEAKIRAKRARRDAPAPRSSPRPEAPCPGQNELGIQRVSKP